MSGALCEEIKDQKEAQKKKNGDLSENWKSERKSEIRKAERLGENYITVWLYKHSSPNFSNTD